LLNRTTKEQLFSDSKTTEPITLRLVMTVLKIFSMPWYGISPRIATRVWAHERVRSTWVE
jgi:hypothetical protein